MTTTSTILILGSAFVIASLSAYRAVHRWVAPMPAPRAGKTYRPLSTPTPQLAPAEVPHLDVDAVPDYSHKRAMRAADEQAQREHAPDILSKREQAMAERTAVIDLMRPFDIALDRALVEFSTRLLAPMSTVQRWLSDSDATVELNLWRIGTPTGEFPIVDVQYLQHV